MKILLYYPRYCRRRNPTAVWSILEYLSVYSKPISIICYIKIYFEVMPIGIFFLPAYICNFIFLNFRFFVVQSLQYKRTCITFIFTVCTQFCNCFIFSIFYAYICFMLCIILSVRLKLCLKLTDILFERYSLTAALASLCSRRFEPVYIFRFPASQVLSTYSYTNL